MKKKKLTRTKLQISSFTTMTYYHLALRGGDSSACAHSQRHQCNTAKRICDTDPPQCDTSIGGGSGNDTNGD